MLEKVLSSHVMLHTIVPHELQRFFGCIPLSPLSDHFVARPHSTLFY